MGRKQDFEDRGYELVPQLLNPEQVERYAQLARQIASDAAEAKHCLEAGRLQHIDGVTARREFWDLIFVPELVQAMRELIGPEIMYVRHTDIHVQHPCQPGWHRDITRPIGDIFDTISATPEVPHQVVRALYFLEDTELSIVNNSHKRSGMYASMKAANVAMKFARRLGYGDVIPPARMTTLKITKGDCVLLNVLAVHTGIMVDDDHPKIGVFLAFGAKNEHSIMHSSQYGARSGKRIPDDLTRALEAHSIGYETLVQDSDVDVRHASAY
jgi:hypothetical protein